MLRGNIPDFKVYLEEMMEKAIMELRQDNAYMDYDCRLSDLDKESIEILKTLPSEDKKTMERLLETKDMINALETEHLYIAGYRDCIALLKTMHIL